MDAPAKAKEAPRVEYAERHRLAAMEGLHWRAPLSERGPRPRGPVCSFSSSPARSASGCSRALGRAPPPTISGADGDVWNAASPVPTYVITTDAPNRRISWSVAGVASGAGRSPLQVRLSGIGDGQYRLVASGQGSRAVDAERAFRVDQTPPRITFRQPTSGMQIEQNALLLADYSCQDAVACTGTLPPGAALDTSQAGPATFSVRALDDAGNEAVSWWTTSSAPPSPRRSPSRCRRAALGRRRPQPDHPDPHQRARSSAGGRRHDLDARAASALEGSAGRQAVQRPGLPSPRGRLDQEGGLGVPPGEPVQGARPSHRLGQPVHLARLAPAAPGLFVLPARHQLLLRPSASDRGSSARSPHSQTCSGPIEARDGIARESA